MDVYSKKYEDIDIEIKLSRGRLILYINGTQRDYGKLGNNELKCRLENGIEVRVIIKNRILGKSAAIYVDNKEIDYLNHLFLK